MSLAPAALMASAATAAVVDWRAVAGNIRTVERWVKPLVTALLVATALTLDPGSGVRRAAFVAALLLSLGGDVALLHPERFLSGLAAFFAAHIAYVTGFAAGGGLGRLALLPAAAAVGVVGLPVARRLICALGQSGQRRLVGPVVAYALALAATTTCALASGRWLAGLGAVLFATSDTLLAQDRFVAPSAGGRTAVMITYHVAQGLLVLSLARG